MLYFFPLSHLNHEVFLINPIKNKYAPFILLTLLGVIWGTGYSIAHFATTHGVSPLGYSFWQALGPALIMMTLAKFSHGKIKLTHSHIRYYGISGLLGIVIPNTTMYLASPHLPTGILAVIVNTAPIIVYPLALAGRLEQFDNVRLSGVLLAILGLMLITLPKASLPHPDMIPWVIFVLITPVSFALCSVYLSRYRPHTGGSLSFAAGTLTAASLILTPLIFGTHHFYLFNWPFHASDYVILLEIILSSVGYLLFFTLIKIAGPVYYSLVNTVVSLVGLLWGYIIFHEKLNQWTLLAVLFILLALYLVTKQQAKVIKIPSKNSLYESLTVIK